MSATKAFSFEPMLCESAEWPPEGPEWHYELKLDGFRAIGRKSGRSAQLWSRNHKDFTGRFPAVTSALLELPGDNVIDGEVVALDKDGKPAFNLLQGFSGEAAEVVLYTFDLLMLRGKDVRFWPLEERRGRLREIVQQLPSTIGYSERFDVPLRVLISAVRQHQFEGIVAKRVGSPYRSGERCGDWLKWRAKRGQEFVIGGYIPNHNIVDSILVGYYEVRDLIYAGRVRAGLTATSRRLLLPHFEELQVPRCGFVNLPERSEGTGEKVSPPRKWICAAGWILSLLPASSFSSGRLSIDCVTRGSSESGATRMLAKSRVTALLKSSTRVDLF